MNLKLYTITGPSNERVAKARFITTSETVVFDVTSTTDDGFVIAATVGDSTVAYRLAYGYVTETEALDALDEFMSGQGFEEIEREDSE